MRGCVISLNTISTILDELTSISNKVSKNDYEALVTLLQRDSSFYFAGEGRSGLVSKAIAMRLMHAGKTVYVVGETTTPAITTNDILIILSGSGESNQVVHLGKQATECGADVFLVTANKRALHHTWCTKGLHLPAATKHRHSDEPRTIQPLGNQFDQAAHIILDAAIIDSLPPSKEQQDMKARHSNME